MQQIQNSESQLIIPAVFGSQSLIDLQREVDALLAAGVEEIAVECGELSRVASSHIGALWLIYCKCEEVGTRMKVTSPTPALIEALTVVDLNELILPGMSQHTSAPLVRIQGDGTDALRVMAMKFRATESEIDNALRSLDEFMARLEIESTFVAAIETIFYEIATNIREHSSLGSSNTIEFSSEADSFGVTMQFVDASNEFDPTLKDTNFDPEKAIREGKTRGFGLAMVKKLSDSFSYLRQDGRQNVLTVTRYWRG